MTAQELTERMTATSSAPDRDAAAARAAARRSRQRAKMAALYAASIAGGIGIWWLLAATAYHAHHLLPTPPEVVTEARTLAANGDLWGNVWPSARRVMLGFAFGVAVAIPVGFLMGWYRLARGLIEPWIQFFRTIPPLALTPMVIILFGIGEVAKVILIFGAAFLATVIATFQGVRSVDVTLIKAARVLGANDWVVFRRVVVPAAMPFIFTGARIGLGSSWATLVAAELVNASHGLGFLMEQQQEFFNTAAIVVAIFCIGILGFAMDRILLLAEGRMTGWQERRDL